MIGKLAIAAIAAAFAFAFAAPSASACPGMDGKKVVKKDTKQKNKKKTKVAQGGAQDKKQADKADTPN